MGALARLALGPRRLAIRARCVGPLARRRRGARQARLNTPLVEVVAAVIERPDGIFLAGAATGGQGVCRLLGISRRQSRAGGAAGCGARARAARRTRHRRRARLSLDRADLRLSARRSAAEFLSRARLAAAKLHGKEAQRLAWQHVSALDVAPLLPANAPVLRALQLPFEYAITHAGEIGTQAQLRLIDQRLAQGLRLIQVREKGMQAQLLEQLRPRGDRESAGVRCASADQRRRRTRPAPGRGRRAPRPRRSSLHWIERPELPWCAASCHTAAELARAVQLGIDFVVLGPVQATPTHPDAQTLGWDGFGALARGMAMPVFALGGMRPVDLEDAWRCGAHGIAMVRGSW